MADIDLRDWETKRLKLVTLPAAFYQILAAGLKPDWSQIGLSNPHQHLEVGPSPIRHRVTRIAAQPSFLPFALRLAVLKESNEIIGSAGFHDLPDENGMIEIGFGITPERRNLGFGKELLNGMWRAIISEPSVKVLRYTVSPENAPSLHIVKNLGFNLVGEQIDDEDGLELIYEMSATQFSKNLTI
jgi:[ribosomal protein S5]-alanine N-acetyltransferase